MGLGPDALFGTIYSDLPDAVEGFNLHSHLGMSYRCFASSYLLSSVIRKWIPKDTIVPDQNAKNSFAAANNRCKDWKYCPRDSLDEMIFGEIQTRLDQFFHPDGMPLISSYFDILCHHRPGPGVSLEALGTSYYTKYFSSKLTSTSEYLYDEYRNYAEWIPTLADADRQRYAEFGPVTVVNSSRSSFVPKTNSTSRMICIEPSLNTIFQLGLASILTDRLDEFFRIRLATQPDTNRRLACRGSIDGSMATIDLSSASDSISLALCEQLFPKWFFELLLTLRSHNTEIDGQKTPLFMISTMGCGFTFPLQTIIFSAVVSSVYDCLGRRRDTEWSVFGDDIVAETFCFSRICRTLRMLGFVINDEKTFYEGRFRESCGSDWLDGRPVRPVFVKKLDSPYDILVAINRLNEWSAYTGISLRNTMQLLFKELGPDFPKPVPFAENDNCGVRVPFSFLSTSSYDGNGSLLYEANESVPKKIRIAEGSIRAPGRLKGKISYNPSGLLMSFLYGEMANSSISIRHDRVYYRARLRCTPFWDYAPADRGTFGVLMSWRQWETAVFVNLWGIWYPPEAKNKS